MARRQNEQRGGAPLMAEGKSDAEVKLILYHWTHSFSSQKVRLVIAEKALKCEEHDVSLPLSEHNEPWFMRLNSTGEVPVLIHGENIICEATQIIDYLEQTFLDGDFCAQTPPAPPQLSRPRNYTSQRSVRSSARTHLSRLWVASRQS
ncbi:ganglioside-induced differentiation-associated protein 1-like [Physeter macrocephalus]|uniref:Ganglioside-induced differentiation-associated protein 1-like n=1 Tax=Physeter macrocephalus TaxID=9755 RepID=A0A455CBB2_PHYMC|nr:ganglioside-induced differentiation-associated protein 1-like [Physeter catodon]|eukprot:XP_028356126.1 ganglioside-induced differentiation-associated protein 1-like [Physeter catodon]